MPPRIARFARRMLALASGEFFCAALMLLPAAVVFAADGAPQNPALAATGSAPDSSSAPVYLIQPDDVLDITVLGQDDLTKSVTVLDDGTISYPCMGQAHVAGMTLAALQAQIVRAISSELVDPQVTVSISQTHVSEVSVLGAVKDPGKIAMKPDWHVLDALAAAGGLSVDRPEYASATLVRAGTQVVPIDVAELMDGTPAESAEMNLPMEPGDVVLVQERDPSLTQVQVIGEVAHPGYWPAASDGSISAVLSEAGGPNPDAALSHATLIHDGVTSSVDLSQVQVDGVVTPNAHVAAGDTLVIPQNKSWFAVYGAVQKPGYIPYPDGAPLTVLGALSQAGGQTSDADLGHASLITVADPPGAPQSSSVTHLNLQALMTKGDATQDVAIPADSILYIPSKSNKNRVTADDLYPIAALLNVIRF